MRTADRRERVTYGSWAWAYADVINVIAGDIRPLLAILTGDESLTGDLGWQDRALCAETDPEIFFPEKGGSVREAKRVCRSCEVRAECLGFAMDRDERFGIYGGMSGAERRRLKRHAA